MSGHTPGPWYADPADDFTYVRVPALERGVAKPAVAKVFKFVPREERKANARLIAASPELLECLRDLLGALSDDNPIAGMQARERARAAIAKAEGR